MPFTRKRLTALILLAMTAMLIAASQADGGNIDAFINQKITNASIPGLSAAIVFKDKVTWSKGYGFANIETNRAVTADTPFTLGSISKTFIATALMQAVESGALSLDTDINNLGLPFVVDNPHIQGEVITLRHLATHTSGLIDSSHYACSYYTESDGSSLLATKGYRCPQDSPTDLSGFLSAYYTPAGILYSSNNFLHGAGATPAMVYSYSNVASALAGYLLETATGTAFDTHSESQIFAPLEMTNTHWHRADFINPDDVAVTYYVDEGQLRPIPAYSLATWPDGGLKSSANDLARYLAAIMNGGELDGVRILKSETVTEMLSQQTTADTEGSAIQGAVQGLFWIILDSYAGHWGGDPGVSTWMLYDNETDVGVVVLANIDDDFSNFEDGRVGTALEEIFLELHKVGNPDLDYDGDGYTENQGDPDDADSSNHPA